MSCFEIVAYYAKWAVYEVKVDLKNINAQPIGKKEAPIKSPRMYKNQLLFASLVSVKLENGWADLVDFGFEMFVVVQGRFKAKMKHLTDAVFWFIHELTYKIVAESGKPSDRYHLGKILLRSLKDAPNHMLQIDGATGEKDTFKSALERSVQCATAFRKLGLKYHDVIVIMAPNHNSLVIPMYAAMFLGIKVAGVDMTLGVNELQEMFKRCGPKIVFCQGSKIFQTVHQALNLSNTSAQIITFDENKDCLSFPQFLDVSDGGETPENFKPAEYDPEETHAFLVTTSGSTGLPKTAILTHKNIMLGFSVIMNVFTKFPTPVDLHLLVSPVQWISTIFVCIMGPILRFTRLQTSSDITPEHVFSLINKYRPDCAIMGPTFLRTLLKPGHSEKCDFSSLEYLLVGGSAVPKELVEEMENINPKLHIEVAYGLTESSSILFKSTYSPVGSVGKPVPHIQSKVRACRYPTTNEIIDKPNIPGELRIKGPTLFQGYYNNPEMSKEAFDEDGWFKTGDMLYRDEYHNYYFCDRIKMLLKYRSHQVSPLEIESVIIKHPGVLDVAVTGIPDAECGDLPVALVIPRDGCNVTAQEIKDLVKEGLTDSKQIRGGVIFVKELPMTPTSKVDRMKLKQLAQNLKRE